MDLKGIVAIGGQSGLFKTISQGKNSLIVESLSTGKRIPAYASSKISALDDIAIFTIEKDVPLKEVFSKIAEKEQFEKCIDHKSDTKLLLSYMEEILPDYDHDRVYLSDLKKLFQWYNILQENNLLKQEPETTEAAPEKSGSSEE
jgi:hypothetical protein